MLIRLLSTAFVLSLLCSCSGYKNAPLGRHAPPADWSGVWTVNLPAGTEKDGNESANFLLVSPMNATIAKLTWMRWNAKPGQETYEQSEHEVSLCKIEGETIGCLKLSAAYHFAVIKAHENGIAAFPISDSTWKEGWSSDEIGRGIAELVRKERGSPKWDAALIKKDGSNGVLLRKTNLTALPEPPADLIAKTQQNKRSIETPSVQSLLPLKSVKRNCFQLSQAELQTRGDAGDNDALLQLAIRYEVGIGVPDDPLKAKEFVIHAKRKGNSLAHVLCNCYGWEAPLGPTPEKTVELLNMALTEPNPEVQQAARYYLAKFYADGIGCDRNPQRAFELAMAGSRAGDNACSYLLARFLANGVGCKASEANALDLWRKLSTAGVTKAKIELIRRAFDHKLKVDGLDPMDALNAMVPDSAVSLMEMAMRLPATPENAYRVTEMIDRAASKGDTDAMRYLRGVYKTSEETLAEAVDDLDEQLRDFGDGYGFFTQATRLKEKDPKKARSQYEIAGWLGFPEAWSVLGIMWLDALGEDVGRERAKRCFRHALINGDEKVHEVLKQRLGEQEYQKLLNELSADTRSSSYQSPVSQGPLKVVDVDVRGQAVSSGSARVMDHLSPKFVTPPQIAERLAEAEKELSRGYPSAAKMTAEMVLPSLSLNKPEHAEAFARAKAIMSAASVELGLGCKDDRVREALQFYTQAVILAFDGVPTDSQVTKSLVAQNPNLVARLVGFSGVAWGRLSVVFHRLKRDEMAEKYWERAMADLEQGRKLATIPALQAELHSRMAHAYINRFKLGLDVGSSTKLAVVHSAEAVRIAESDPTAVLAQAEAYCARALATVLVAHQSGVRDLADSSLEPIWRDLDHVAELTSGEFHNSPVSGVARRLLQTKPDQSAGMSEFAARIFGSLVNITDPFQMPQAEVDEMQRQGNAIMHDANAAAQARGQPAPYPGY